MDSRFFNLLFYHLSNNRQIPNRLLITFRIDCNWCKSVSISALLCCIPILVSYEFNYCSPNHGNQKVTQSECPRVAKDYFSRFDIMWHPNDDIEKCERLTHHDHGLFQSCFHCNVSCQMLRKNLKTKNSKAKSII